jgi:hypothetical protein
VVAVSESPLCAFCRGTHPGDLDRCICGAWPTIREIVARASADAEARLADVWETAAGLAETCETGERAAAVIRFTARSLAALTPAPTTDADLTGPGERTRWGRG